MHRSLVIGATLLAACIIPDRNIETEEIIGNPGAVRIIEPTNLPAEFIVQCEEERGPTCPQVPTGRRSGLVTMQDEQGLTVPFCVCPEGSSDTRVVEEFFVYAEDPDNAAGNNEALFAVALLDLDPLTDEPQEFVAYDQQLAPGQIGESFSLFDLDRTTLNSVDLDAQFESLLIPSEERQAGQMTRFRFGKNNGEGTDLCNDNNGQKLPAGMHTLQVMVTDRPFFRPPLRDADGELVLGLNGAPEFGGLQYGMPDIAAGATWSIANYVFECIAEPADTAEEDSRCECTEVEAP